MISNKKSYAMKMLQLALALSLLHVDPSDIYLQQRLRSWDAQLDLRHGDGWELEMLRTVPMIESQHPYANRKTMTPLIEDLIRFDQHAYKLPTRQRYNVTAYVLNVHNDSSIQTAALQELQGTGATSGTASASSSAAAGAAALEHVTNSAATAASSVTVSATNGSNYSNTHNAPSPDLSLFLNSEQFQDHRSIWEQNLADLQDYGDLSVASPYANLPLKDGQLNNSFLDMNLENFLHGFANAQSVDGAAALNDSTPHPSGSSVIKLEQFDDDEDDSLFFGLFDNVASCSSNTGGACAVKKEDEEEQLEADQQQFDESQVMLEDAAANVEVKTEEEEPEQEQTDIKLESDNNNGAVSNYDVDLSPFINDLALSDDEENEIVEVLWKQDVDLGYSLNQEDQMNASLATSDGNNSSENAKKLANGNTETENARLSNEDIEKLKALEELSLQDKPKDHNDDGSDENALSGVIENEWDGIPFTIDNETGEYIRLPLDELINDVLQLAQLAEAEAEVDDSIASTSRAAAAACAAANSNSDNNSNRIVSETGEEFVDNNNKPNSLKRKNNTENAYDEDDDDDDNNNNNNANNDNDTVDDFDDLGNCSNLPSPLFDLDDEAKKELDDLDKMLQSAAPPYHHHAHHPHHVAAHHHHAAAAAAAHHHHQRAAAAAVGGVQPPPNYASVGSGANSAFHRQSGGFHHGHHQGRMPLSRSVSMEQRLQDIATFFTPIPSMGVADMSPYPHYPSHHYSYQGAAAAGAAAAMPNQHAQYGTGAAAPPPPPHHGHHDLFAGSQPHYGHNLGSAVTSSMHLTNATHDPADAVGAASNAYKMEHDMMYYSNASSDMNHTTEGFINSILNDEDLHLMDMSDPFCRMVDNSTSNNSSVLGLPSSGHGSSTGTGPGTGGNSVALSMSGATGGSVAAGMTTAELLVGGGAAGGGQTGGAGDRLDASSDSAVSSMGSERVPSLSDGEWGEGSDSAQDYHQGKYGGGGPYDYSYNNTTRISTITRQPPVAQKKHQMFGKRYQHEQTPSAGGGAGTPIPATPAGGAGAVVPPTSAQLCNGGGVQPTVQSIKYEYEPYPGGVTGLQHNAVEPGAMGGVPALATKEQHQQQQQQQHHHSSPYGSMGGGYSVDYSVRPPRTPQDMVQHNHTYTLPQGSGSLPRPQQRDKKIGGAASKNGKSAASMEDEHLTRDEKRARSLNIPITVSDIINLPMDEFNERLSKYDLNENQLSLIRDIRRRGKNKVAAQNCRKRKLDQILTLEDEVNAVRKRKEQLNQDRDLLANERHRISTKFAQLHKHVFQYLRDPEGNPCSPSDYSLQQAADGSIYLLRRDHKADGGNATAASGAVAVPGAGLNHHNVNGAVPVHGHLATTHSHHQQHALTHQQQQQQQQQTRRQQQQQQQQQQPTTDMHFAEYQHHPTQQKE